MIDSLEIILKVSERCNIKCTYCYFFFGEDKSFEKHSAVLGEASVGEICDFIERAILENDLKSVQLDLHGGEPLLMKKTRFVKMLQQFEAFGQSIEMRYTIQTNGMLIDADWIEIFTRFRVHVSLSLDGPKNINDYARIDKKNRGTYERTIKGLKQVQSAVADGKLDAPSILCVVNTQYKGAEIYRHFVDDLQVKHMDFLFPDNTHMSLPKEAVGAVGVYLRDVFDEWTKDDNPDIEVRFIDHYLKKMLRSPQYRANQKEISKNHKVVTISSDAGIAPDDIIRSAVPSFFENTLPVSEISINEFIQLPVMKAISEIEHTPPKACRGCMWEGICEGGDHIIHRYDEKNMFENQSVFCEDMKIMLTRMAKYCLENLIDTSTLTKNLGG